MPYFQIDGKAIVKPTDSKYAECPVEVISSTQSAGDSTFFKPTGTVHINGVTDSGYKLCSPLKSSTSLIRNAGDVFKGNLQVDTVAQPYCKKGCAPVGECLYTAGQGSFTLVRKTSGEFYIQNSSGTRLHTLSTAAQNRKIFTIAMCAGGGGGGGGEWGLFGASEAAGGGGSGSCIVIQFKFADNITSDLTFSLTVGAGGGGGGEGKNGSGGNDSVLSLTSPRSVELIRTYAGGGGKRGNDGSGGGGGGATSKFNFTDSVFEGYDLITSQPGLDGYARYNEVYNNGSTLWLTENWTINPTGVISGDGPRLSLGLGQGYGGSWYGNITQDEEGGAGAPSWFTGCTPNQGYSFWEPYIYGTNTDTVMTTVVCNNSYGCTYWAKLQPGASVNFSGSGLEFVNAYPYWGAGGYGGCAAWAGSQQSGGPGGSGMFSIFY